jgi:quercetin dioxygenase-like cupin family protein
MTLVRATAGMHHVPKEATESVEAVPGVHLSKQAEGDRMNVQGFYVEPGASIPAHSHPHEQAGYVASGTLTFVLRPRDEASDGEGTDAPVTVNGDPVDPDGSEVQVSAGDSYVIPGGEPHGAVNRGEVPVEGVDVFSPPRTDPDWD